MTLTEQFTTMIAMFAMGVWIGVGLSTYHRFLRPSKRRRWLLVIADILFWMIQGALIFLVLLNVNEGEIRFYIFLALACGYSAYKALLQTLYEKCLEAVIQAFLAVTRFIGRVFYLILVQPIYLLLKFFYYLGKLLFRVLFSVLLFVYFPFKWLFRWLIPSSWKTAVRRFYRSIKRSFMKGLKWFKK